MFGSVSKTKTNWKFQSCALLCLFIKATVSVECSDFEALYIANSKCITAFTMTSRKQFLLKCFFRIVKIGSFPNYFMSHVFYQKMLKVVCIIYSRFS